MFRSRTRLSSDSLEQSGVSIWTTPSFGQLSIWNRTLRIEGLLQSAPHPCQSGWQYSGSYVQPGMCISEVLSVEKALSWTIHTPKAA